MKHPIVNIVGLDDLDICVAENVRRFYRQLGCRTIVSREPLPADILVVLRGVRPNLDCSGYQDVHIFNYVGQDRSAMTVSGASRILFLEASDTLINTRPNVLGNAIVDRVTTWHPVFPELWSVGLKEIAHPVTHVGNFKPIIPGSVDKVQESLLKSLEKNGGYVWGRGWDGYLAKSRCMGSVSLWKVRHVLASSFVTLGVRYPYQRKHNLISGRYWLAPLNGCPLVSEEDSGLLALPGVHFGSFSTALDFGLSGSCDRKELIARSGAYWEEHTNSLIAQIAPRVKAVTADAKMAFGHSRISMCYSAEVWLRRLKSAVE